MKRYSERSIIFGLILVLGFKSSAFTLKVNDDINPKHYAIFEHLSTGPHQLTGRSTEITLEKYPNVVYFIYSKSISPTSAQKPKFLAMIWVASETAIVELTIDESQNITIKNETAHQKELNEIFAASNIWSSFPYDPKPDKPLEPILALEAKSLIQNLSSSTDRTVLENLLDLSQKRKIDNWCTDALSAFLNEPANDLYNNGQLIKIFGFDSLEHKIELAPNNKRHIFIAISGSWCGPCIKGIPKLKKMNEQLKDDLHIVSLWNDPNLNTFNNNHRDKKQLIDWMSLWDQYGLMASALKVKVYPTYILFDSAGKEVKRWDGKLPNNLSQFMVSK